MPLTGALIVCPDGFGTAASLLMQPGETMRAKGDNEGAETWLRISVAIGAWSLANGVQAIVTDP